MQRRQYGNNVARHTIPICAGGGGIAGSVPVSDLEFRGTFQRAACITQRSCAACVRKTGLAFPQCRAGMYGTPRRFVVAARNCPCRSRSQTPFLAEQGSMTKSAEQIETVLAYAQAHLARGDVIAAGTALRGVANEVTGT